MANKSLTDLPARTATADSDLLHINSGGTDYKETKSDFLRGDFAYAFDNTSTLTSQVDALTVGSYFGTIASYGHQSETGVPSNTNYYVQAFVYSGTVYRKIILQTLNSDAMYIKYKYSDGSWSAWVDTPTRAEITSINNSLANIGSRNVSHYAQHATSATMAYTGVSFTITKKSIVRADLYYTYSTPQEIAICGSSSGNQSFYANATAVANMTNVMLSCTAVLDPGTFYVWARSGASENNNIGLYGIQIEP